MVSTTSQQVGFVYIMVDRQLQQPIKARLRQRRLAELGVVPGSATDMALQPEDLNTDGIDVSGKDVWIHDCEVHNDDDSIAIKSLHSGGTVGSPAVAADCSGDMLVENVVLAGFGASIGSVPPNVDPTLSCVNNVTFRNVSMPDTGKGIYLKSNPSCGEGKTTTITNVAFHTVDILRPRWWAVWIGPQQQHQPHASLGQACALFYPIVDSCPTQGCALFANISLTDVNITSPFMSPGILLGNATQPMRNVTFTNVQVTDPGAWPFDGQYQCENVDATSVDSDPPLQCTHS